MSVKFEDLLGSVSSGDVEKLQTRKAALLAERTKLQTNLAKMNRELADIEVQIAAPIRNAVKAATLLGVDIPEKYKGIKANGTGEGKRSQGKFRWESSGLVPFQAEVSRAMWRLSTGSGGSAGKNGEGVLTADEFWALAKIEESKMKLGDKHSLTLPNGKEVTFEKVEE